MFCQVLYAGYQIHFFEANLVFDFDSHIVGGGSSRYLVSLNEISRVKLSITKGVKFIISVAGDWSLEG